MNLKLLEAIERYTPNEDHNNTNLYQRIVLESVGGQDKLMKNFTLDEQDKIIAAMRRVEGWKEGKVKELLSIK